MTSRFNLAASCAVLIALASTAIADNARPGDAGRGPNDRNAPASPENWVFGTHVGDNFCDDFDSYQAGSLCTQSTWEEWSGSVDVCGVVSTDQSSSGPNSLNIIGDPPGSAGAGDDTVHRFIPIINGGVWTFSIMTYVPTGMTGHGWIILLNQYPATPNWSLQVHLQDDGNIVADFVGESLPLIYDQWVEFRAEIDLGANPQGPGQPALGSVDYFYDDVQFVFDKEWSDIGGAAGPGLSKIAAIDLYGGDAGSPGGPTNGVYFDNVQLYQSGSSCEGACDDPCDMNCDGVVDASDIEPFIGLLFNGDTPCNSCTGDTNGDGSVDAGDIEGFINCLFGP